MASVVVNSFKSGSLKGEFNLPSDTLKTALLKPTFFTSSPYSAANRCADLSAYSSISATYEVTGTGYTNGGLTLSGVSVTHNNTTDKAIFDANDLRWSSSTLTSRGCVIYKNNNRIVCVVDFGSNKISTNGNFDINWNSHGITTLT
jgi:hypothetical protein